MTNKKQDTKMLDISSLTQEAIAHEVHHPKTGELLGLSVNLLPVTDPKIKALQRKIQDRKSYLGARGKTLKAEELEEFRIELAATAITGWNWYGDITFHGEKPACNPKNIREVCNTLEWFLDEIDETLGDGKAFFID